MVNRFDLYMKRVDMDSAVESHACGSCGPCTASPVVQSFYAKKWLNLKLIAREDISTVFNVETHPR